MSNPRTSLAQAIVAWLNDPASISAVPADKQSQLAHAASAISSAFSLEGTTSAGNPNLQTIYEVFLKTQQKTGGAGGAGGVDGAASDSTAAPAAPATSSSTAAPSNQPSTSMSASTTTPASPEDLKAADEHKTAGNKSISAKDYGAAIASYTKAIDLNKSPIYYSNRAAAYSQVGQHDKAIEDARQAARIDPNFGKAYSRLGHALFSSGKYQEAVDAYQRGLLVDPDNKLMQSGLETAKNQAAKSGAGASSSSSPATTRGAADSGAGGAGAGASAGAGMGGFPGMGGGGMPDLASLMNNPMMQQMAQNMMANGGLEQLMNNPMLRSMAERMGGGGGGMPDMSQIQQLMQDPQMASLARQFMGGGGGGGGGAGGAGGAGSGAGNNMFG